MDYAGTMSEPGAALDDPLQVTIDDVKPVVACRGCLATDHPLWPLEQKLADAYSLLISKIHDSDIHPKYICHYCRAFLIKCVTFRNKCLVNQSTLTNIHSMGIPITLDLVKSCYKISSYPLKLTETLLIDINDVESPQMIQNFEKSIATDHLIVQKELKTEPKNSEMEKDYKIEVEIIPDDKTIIISDFNNESLSQNASKYFDYQQEHDFFDKFVKTQQSDNSHDKYQNPKPDNHENSDSDEPLTNDEPCIAQTTLDEPCIDPQNNDEPDIDPQNNEQVYKILGKRLTKKQMLYNEKRLKKRAEFEKKFNVRIVKISQERQIQQVNERKDTDKYKNALYKCELCYSGFKTNITYMNHMAKHQPVKGYFMCEICKIYYQTVTILSSHMQRHTNDYICNICGHISKSSGDARIHGNAHSGVVYDCNLCGKAFSKPSTLTSHMVLTHRGDVPCPICNNLFLGEAGLNLHMKVTHKEAIGAVCPSCGVQFHSVSAMQRHRPHSDCDHTHRPCTACGRGFATDSQLKKHRSSCESRKMYRCDICSVDFDSLRVYYFHVRNRHNVSAKRIASSNTPRTNAAPLDGANTIYKAPEPRKTVAPKKMCEFCGKSVLHSGWDIHRRRYHSDGETLYNCDHCGKGYHIKKQLEGHMFKHMALKRSYACKYCTKAFSSYGSNYRHEKLVHEGLRRHACDICGYSFKARGDLRRHVQHTHAGVPWPKRNRSRHGDNTCT